MRHNSKINGENTQPQFIQTELKVVRKQWITPHYIRIFLTGNDIARINNTTVGVNNKIMIPPAGVEKIHFPEFDYENRKWHPMPDSIRPTVRTYTHRGIDVEKKEIWIDFAVHGEEGPASKWATHAHEGDILGLLMREGETELYLRAENYLLVGDATAIPVLGAILEDLPATAKGTCIIEVQNEQDKQTLQTRADIKFIWIYNEHPQQGSQLAHTVRALQLPESARAAYVAAEYSSVKEIRSYLRKEMGWNSAELYAYSYWKSGMSEDRSDSARREEGDSV